MPKKQKDGRYRSKVTIGYTSDGKPLVKYISGTTKVELEKARQQVISTYIDHARGTAADQLLGEYAVNWWKVRKEPFISASTRNGYRSMLNKHILPYFGDRNLRAISPTDLQMFLNGFAGASKSQIQNAITVLKDLFAAAIDDRIISVNPMEHIRAPKHTPAEERRALTDQERAVVERIIETHPDGLYLGVMYYTGMRPGEVRGLQWGDIDWERNLIHVQRDIDYATHKAVVGELKTAAADRYIPITARLRAILWPYRGLPKAFLFHALDGSPLPQATAQRKWLRLMVACGMAEQVPEAEVKGNPHDIRNTWRTTVKPYAMRHNFITMCWENGIDIMLTMKMVGHADYETTRKIYTHLSDKHMQAAAEQLNSAFPLDAGEKFVAEKLPKLL